MLKQSSLIRSGLLVAALFLVGVAFAATLISQLSAAPSDWPNSRNDPGNAGNSGETIPLPLAERWHSSAPVVEENGAVVSNGIVYMSTYDGKLYAFDVATGSVVSGFPVNTASNFGAPAVDAANQKVYVLAGGTLFAFNFNGTTAWTALVGSEGNSYNVGPVVEAGVRLLQGGRQPAQVRLGRDTAMVRAHFGW